MELKKIKRQVKSFMGFHFSSKLSHMLILDVPDAVQDNLS